MSKDDAVKKITSRSTRQEVLDAYQEVLKQLQEKRKEEQKPQAQVEEKKTREVLSVADSLSTEGIAKEIGNLKSEIGKMLVQLSDKLESEIARYESVKKAVEAREKELAEIYEIEKTASSLAALIETQRMKREQFDAEMAEERQSLEEEIETRRSQWEKEIKQREAELKEFSNAEKKKYEREMEEFKYSFEREKKLTLEKFEDEKARWERETQLKREEMLRDLAEREKVLVQKEQELSELRRKVESFPKELQDAINKATAETAARIQKEADNKIELLTREFNGERNVLNAKIESLEKSLKEQNIQLAKISQQLEKSYGQVQDIAMKAIEGSSNIKPLSNLEQILTEQVRKKSKDE